MKYKVTIEDSRIPITPLDKCFSNDGRVYVIFFETQLTRLIGTIDANIPGLVPLRIVHGNFYEFTVDAPTVKSACLLCKGLGYVQREACQSCAFE
jgi:hypothetical protein